MGQDKPFSSALSNLAKMKTDAEKANEKVQAATDKAVAFAQSLKQGTNQAGQAPAAPAKPAAPAAPRPAQAASAPAAPARPAAPQARPAAPAAPRPAQTASAPARPAAPAAPAKPAAPAAPAKPASSLKPLDEIAKLVIRGNYGNGEERKKRLTAEGYDYAQVQKRVNELLK